MIDHKTEDRIHLNLLEIHKKHQGRQKEIDGIAGCLIAFAASISIKRGYDGFVSLEPKTKLIDLYQDYYGFRQYGPYLGIEGETSQYLVIRHFFGHTKLFRIKSIGTDFLLRSWLIISACAKSRISAG